MVIGAILTVAWAALVVRPREWRSLRDMAVRLIQRFGPASGRPGGE
jgi:hypothetical protein